MKKIIFILILFVVGMALWKYKEQSPVTQSTPPPTTEVFIPRLETHAEKPNILAVEKTFPSIKEVSSFQSNVSKCLASFSSDSYEDSTGLAEQLSKRAIKKILRIENFHIDRNGTEERWMIAPRDTLNSASAYELRYFTLDKEGLPLAHKKNPLNTSKVNSDILNDIQTRGDLKFHQKKESLTLKDGSQADIEWIDNKVRDFELRKNGKLFSCRENKCICH